MGGCESTSLFVPKSNGCPIKKERKQAEKLYTDTRNYLWEACRIGCMVSTQNNKQTNKTKQTTAKQTKQNKTTVEKQQNVSKEAEIVWIKNVVLPTF